MMKIDKNFIIKRILPIVLGMLAGYAYYYFIGCANGSSPITSNPYISTIYGGIAGLLLSFPSKKKEEQNDAKQS